MAGGTLTPDALFAALEGKKMILHRGQVFFNERDLEEVTRWQALGARIVPWYPLEDQQAIAKRRAKLGIDMPRPGWEVHVLPMLEEYWVSEEGGEGEYDAFPEDLRNLCRQSL